MTVQLASRGLNLSTYQEGIEEKEQSSSWAQRTFKMVSDNSGYAVWGLSLVLDPIKYLSTQLGITTPSRPLTALTASPLSSSEEKKLFDVEQAAISVIKSLIDPSTISEIVKKCYAFDKPVNSRVLNIGINDMYIVETDNKKYVLRLSRSEKYLTMTDSEFQFELEWLNFLNKHQVPVSYPIRRIDNQFCGLINAPEGPRYATLFSYAEGTTDMDVEQASILGKELANLHVVSDSFQTTLDRAHLDLNQLITLPLQEVKDFLGGDNEKKCALLDEVAEQLTKQISDFDMSENSYGIIAGDIHGYNQHFDVNNQLTMFDFEFCAYGYRVYDIATFKWSRGSDNKELWDAFLNGYQSIRILTNSEIQAIDVFVKARHLWWMKLITTLPESAHSFDNKFWDQAFSRFNSEKEA